MEQSEAVNPREANVMGGHARRTALVTGASGGIGRELAGILAQNGYDLVLVSRCSTELEDLAKKLGGSHVIHAVALSIDLSAGGCSMSLCGELRRRNLEIDVLVNNAGFAIQGEFSATDVAAQLRLLQLNIMSVTHLTHLLLPGMIERGWGRILNVSSIAAFVPGPLMATYNASKSYVLSFSEAIAHEVRGTGVTVTALCPGPTKTRFADRAGLADSKAFQIVMDAGDVARAGYAGMMKGKSMVIPGMRNKLRKLPLALVPRRVLAHFARKYHENHGRPASAV